MACDQFRDAISALVDGEEPDLDPRLVDAHVAHCAACAEYRATSESVRRRMRVREVTPDRAPDRDASRRITALAAAADRASSPKAARIVLLVVAIEILVLSLVDLVTADGDPDSVHGVRHLSAFTIAYGVLLLVVVARPARARTALPVAAVLAGALAITAVVDLATGRVPLLGEALHLPEIVSVVLIWMLANGRRSERAERSSGGRSEMTIVPPVVPDLTPDDQR